jgi:hypothetical protein
MFTESDFNRIFLYAEVIRHEGGHAVAQFGFRHCATSREVAGSIPDEIIAIFHLIISSGGPGFE